MANESVRPYIASLLQDQTILIFATVCFCLAILHTFVANKIHRYGNRFPRTSVRAKLFDFLGEIEIPFGIWAFVFVAGLAVIKGSHAPTEFLSEVNFAEPVFVFAIMCMAATKPILYLSSQCIVFVSRSLSRLLALPRTVALYATILVMGPLAGSFVTEPVAMTVAALLLKAHFFDRTSERRFKYATMALLFVNVSIGGTLTHFAAPPVLMVAKPWGWDTLFMLQHFGLKSVISIVISTILCIFLFRKTFIQIAQKTVKSEYQEAKTQFFGHVPYWVVASNLVFLVLCVYYHKHIAFILPLFLLFIGWHEVTQEYQKQLKLRESLLVGLFLGGVVTLGTLQQWWLSPILQSLSTGEMYVGAIGLTAVTDNAALTFLGTLVPNLSDSLKYVLVAGAVVGGGLTVIANAPNPIGHGILSDSFGNKGVSPLIFFLWALPFTVIAALCFWVWS